MSLFLVDVNLPKNFSFFNHDNFIFVADINLQMTDTEIWNYALKNNLIILTKDADFYSKFLLSDTFPKIVYFKIGNCSLKQLHAYFNSNWTIIEREIQNCRFIIAKEDHIESIY
ncbi:DUF5615 family PIN-like protein [Flavobacterium solisilvae]|uniref:DUF5615 family PIN-like protein n=1 Tax=Flavobacterium solisilvae TaxID=1852019 RepID=A0ABX1QQE1_9FLAO|nr:DUF5615 family PIN-like protein [Flavobacterium solisilvae]NMH24409.1 DUF5615 family PIN-like protein [Flavobacterium solisilvae]